MTPEFKVDFDRGARIGLDEALFCESKTVDQISAIVDAVKAKTGRLLLTRLDQSKYEALFARQGAQLEYRPPFPHRHSWPTSSRAAHRAGGDRHGRDVRPASRSRGCADSSLRRPAVSRIYGCRRRGPLAPPRTDRRYPIVSRCHRGRGHGRGAGQRRRRSGFQRGDRTCRRPSAMAWRRAARQRCTPRWPVVRLEYRSSISTMATARLARPCGYRAPGGLTKRSGTASSEGLPLGLFLEFGDASQLATFKRIRRDEHF